VKKLRLALPAAFAAALVVTSPASAFTPTNTYYGKQWYLAQDRAFDAWPAPPLLDSVKVGIVDSGVDCSLPDFDGRIALTKSFVGGSGCTDSEGHGTIVAGEIAGDLDSAGVVGLAFASQLLVAKVVAPDGSIPIKAEAAGIRWAVNHGARVVNLSFGAVRDPLDPALDTFSKAEAKAVAFAVKRGAVVVAAVGNADDAYATPWPYASWPAALPHVLGVAALTRSGDVPDFSDRDPRFVDVAAPGVDIFSTFPKNLTNAKSSCAPQGYTDCATGDYHRPEGTSFAAPQVSAAAAVLLGLEPGLSSSQVSAIIERHTDDVDAASGCDACPTGRDKYSGWGRLDVEKTVAFLSSGNPLPPADRLEPNDKLSQARTLWGRRPGITATLDHWDDRLDVYRVRLDRGERLQVLARARWKRASIDLTLRSRSGKLAQTPRLGKRQHLGYRARRTGWYSIVLVAHHGFGRYALRVTKTR
jgi:subtilisin family serine protease